MEGPQGLHRRWFHLTAVRRNNLFEFYLDNQLMCSFRDEKEPLKGKRFCIWTYDNGIMVARVRVSAEQISERKTLIRVPDSPAAGLGKPADKPSFLLTSSTHPLGMETIARRKEWILRKNREEGVKKPYVASVESGRFKGRKGCLKATNRISGGKFSIKLFEGEETVGRLQLLNFDYLLETEDVKMDLFFITDRGWYYVRFTGDEDPFLPGKPPFYPMKLSSISPVADGKWHSATVDVYNLFKYFTGAKDFAGIKVKGIFMGHARYGYTDAGLGGNFSNSCIFLDNVRFTYPGSDTFKVKWKAVDKEYSKYVFALDARSDTIPGKKPVKTNTFERDSLLAGTHYFHIAGIDAKGKRSPVIHYRIDVDKKTPEVKGVEFGPASALVKLHDEGSGVDWNSVNVLVGNKRLTVGSPGFTVQPGDEAVLIDYADAGIVLEQGDVHVSVVGAKDRTGNMIRKATPFKGRFAYKDDKEPPKVDFVVPDFMRKRKYGFEYKKELWQSSVGDKAIAMLDRNVAFQGRSSMALINNDYASAFKFIRPEVIDAAETPYLTFMYKLQPDARSNFAFDSVLGHLNVRFADRNTDTYTVGVVSGVKWDKQWHKAEINLRDLLLKRKSNIPSMKISNIYFEDISWRSADPMTKYWIDDLFFHSVYDNSKGNIRVWLNAGDPSGISTVAYRFVPLSAQNSKVKWISSNNPKPDKTGFIPIPIPRKLEGANKLEVYAQDKAGNKSEVKSLPLILDNTPPKIASIVPAPFVETASSKIALSLTDTHSGIKHQSVLLNVNGREYRMNSNLLEYSPKTGVLSFDISRSRTNNVFPDKRKIKVGVYAEDGAGHPVKHMWYWTMNYQMDAAPPPQPFLTFLPAPKYTETFEDRNLKHWQNYGGSRGARTSVTNETSALGRYCVKIQNVTSGGYNACAVRRKAFDGLQFSQVAFDYKIPKDVHIDFVILVDGAWYPIQLSGARNHYHNKGKYIGKVPCKNDGKWHHAEFDLGAMLRKQFPNRKNVIVRNIIMGEYDNKYNNKTNAVFYMDNFAVFTPKDKNPYRVAWTDVYDATGIRTYLYKWSNKKKAVPDIEAGRKTQLEIPPPGAGTWYLHVSAIDNNQNKSKPVVLGPIEKK
jgi:hypothetical protein